MPVPPRLKGLRKAGRLPLLQPRLRSGWVISDYRIRELFESADVMSEGAWRPSPSGAPNYFGTTSIVLPVASAGGDIPDDLLEPVAAVLKRDPHVRLRALRIACREANVRAETALMSIRTELSVALEPRGIRIHIDVEAQAAAALSAPEKAAR